MSNICVFRDITSQCTFQNGWRAYDTNFKVYLFGNILFISGLFVAGTVGVSVNILKLPADIASRVLGEYHYLLAQRLATSVVRQLTVRRGYICQDNNLPVDASTGQYVSINGILPLQY